MARFSDAIRLEQQGDPSSPGSGQTALYKSSAYGQIRTKNSSGAVKNIPYEFSYNVKDYGAVGDGTTNDATAVQAVLDLASSTNPGSMVYFPPGTYNINISGTPPVNGLEIKGSCDIYLAPGATIIRGNSAMQYLFQNFNPSYAPTAYGGRGNIAIRGRGTLDGGAASFTTSCTVVCFAQCDNILVEDITIQNVVDWHAVEFNSTRNGTIRNVTAQGFKVVTAGRYISEAFQIDLAINSAALPGIGSGAYDNTPCQNITIDGCTVRGLGTLKGFGAVTGSHSWADGHKHKDIKVIGNSGYNLSDYMVNATNWDVVTVSDNNCIDSNSFLQVMVPSSMTADVYNFTVDGNIIENSGIQNDNTAVNAYCVNIQGIDTTNSGALTSVDDGFYIQNPILSNNIFDKIANTDSVIRSLNALNLIVEACTFNNITAAATVMRSTGNRSAHIAECRLWNFVGKGVLIEQGTSGTGPPTSISSQIVMCTMENGADDFIDAVSWQVTVTGCTLMSQNTSAKSMIYIHGGATDSMIMNNTIWRRDGSSSANGIVVNAGSGDQRLHFRNNTLKGFAAQTSTAASAVTGTAVWAINGTTTLTPTIATFFSMPTNGVANNIYISTN